MNKQELIALIREKKAELSRRELASGYQFCRAPAVQALANEIPPLEAQLAAMEKSDDAALAPNQ
jgi:hypothetical protein